MRRDRVYFSPQALELMMSYPWPGNVRELQNEIQKCLILWEDESLITEAFLSPRINPGRKKLPNPTYNFFCARSEFEKRFLNQALDRFGYSRVKTAKELGLSRQGLFKLIKKHNIAIPQRLKV
jgi:DNA-binding NtrC family response regulator